LERVFVDLSIVIQQNTKPNKDPLRAETAELPKGRNSVWEYLKADGIRNLIIIGSPGSGKTTLLKHMALTLAAGKKQCEKENAPHKLPLLLFLRDHADKICPRDDKGAAVANPPALTLAQAVRDSMARSTELKSPDGWFEERLERGECLVLMDGLDEVADAEVRKKVVAWAEQQMQTHGKNSFVMTSRPHGYENNSLQGVHVLEIRPFTRAQQEQFVSNWYLANEIQSMGKDDEGVKMEAREQSAGLLQRIRSTPALADLAVNPLLLTMITTVHRYRGSLPGRRVELYGEICDVFLGKRRAATGLTEEFTPLQKQRVLQPLAYEMMCRETREISLDDAITIIAEPLRMVGGYKTRPEDFLKMIENGSGLFLERDNSIHSFSHLTFQEYLAAVHIKEQCLEVELSRHVAESWWHETIRLYCVKAPDASTIIENCIGAGSYPALTLAVECLEEGSSVNADIRSRIDDLLHHQIESGVSSEWRVAAEILLRLRLGRMVRLDENKSIDNDLITHGEYQLFLDEMREQEKYYQPDHWAECHFPKGKGLSPIVGVRPSDAVAFCEWLTTREEKGWRYRLPNQDEVKINGMPKYTEYAGYWISDGEQKKCIPVSAPPPVITLHQLKARRQNDLALISNNVQSLSTDYENALGLALDRAVQLDHNLALRLIPDPNLAHRLKRNPTRDHTFDLILNRNPLVNCARTRQSIRTFALGAEFFPFGADIYVIMALLEERIEGNLPAWEGIRIVREKAENGTQ
jgi:energy-coupling factor transporter ATP-binding protein EcfA2